MKTKASLIPNLDHKTRKNKMTKSNKDPTRFYLQRKNKTRLWQKNTPKIVLNKLKVMGNFTSIYIHWELKYKKIQKNYNLHVDYEWTKT